MYICACQPLCLSTFHQHLFETKPHSVKKIYYRDVQTASPSVNSKRDPLQEGGCRPPTVVASD